MKEEEIDWIVYHQIDQIGPAPDERIADVCGFSLPQVAASLERLEKNFLVSAGPEGWRVLSIQESMVRCQFAYADGFPLTIENGVIRAREPSDE
ncbi:MAG: MarR family transcriptional regulator [Methanomicrobiales archaeon]